MLARVQWQRHIVLRRQIAAPHAATIHNNIGGDMAFDPVSINIVYACHTLFHLDHFGDFHSFKNQRAAHTRPFSQSHGDIGRVALPIKRQMHGPHHIGHIQVRIHGFHIRRRDFMHFHIQNPRQSGLAQQFFMACLGKGHGNRSHLPHSRGHTSFGFKVHIKLG